MANYATLKAAIDAAIKTNGNQEITGAVLNQVLTAMVNSLGAKYQFAGVATPSTNPGTPDQNVFYVAMQAGTYSNFNAIVLPDGLSVLKWNGSWSADILSYGTDGVYDISAAHNNTPYIDLAAALGTGGGNIPEPLRKGGMIVKFIKGFAQSSDNKYVQYRLISDTFNTTPSNWVQETSKEEITGILYKREDAISLTENADLNNLILIGSYSFTSAVSQTLVHSPQIAAGGFLTVERITPGNVNFKLQTIEYSSGEKYYRIYNGSWTSWNLYANYEDILDNITGNLYSYNKAVALSNNADLDTLPVGLYSFTSAVAATLALPESGGGYLFVVSSTPSNTNSFHQRVCFSNGHEYHRTKYGGVYNSWTIFATINDITGYIYTFDEAIVLSSDSNLGSLSLGLYSFTSAVATALALPLSKGGYLKVERATPSFEPAKVQKIQYSNAEQYYRYFDGSIWSSWTKVGSVNSLNIEVPEYWLTKMTSAVNSVLSNRLVIGNNLCEFIFITDTHYLRNAKQSATLIAYLQKNLDIAHVIFGGDAISYSQSTALEGIKELRDFVAQYNYKLPIFFTVGNHDKNNYTSESAKLTSAQLYSTVGKQTESYAVTDKNMKLSYFDNINQKVRYVQYYYELTDAQEIIDVISGLSSDWTVVFFTHEYWEANGQGVAEVKASCRTMMNNIINGQYDCTIAAFIVGHIHKDMNDVLDNDIPVISTTTDCYQMDTTNMTLGTDTEQAFDIIQLDTNNRKLYFTRIGAGNNREFSY